MEIEDVSKNTKILLNNAPYNVEEVDFVKPGKGSAIYKLRLRNLLNNAQLEQTYRSAAKVEETRVETRDTQYLYQEGDRYIFMDSETFEQIMMAAERIGDRKYYLKEGTPVVLIIWEGQPIDITLPITVELKVVQSAVSSRADTVTAQPKMATMETGLSIGVPSFVKEGDILKIDTRTGAYVERLGGVKG
ncbi:MAG: elongation factor P [Chloroflexota bacterium]